MPGGLEPFRQMGLWNTLDSVPHVRVERVGLYANGAKVATAELPGEAFGEYAPRWVSQPDLLEAIVREAERFPAFTLRRGTAVRHLLEQQGRVVGVGISRASSEEELRGDFVIGADGRSSMVRKRSGS